MTQLANGNYVVESPEWDNGLGAATFGSSTTGVAGVISAANSLIGATTSDHVGGVVVALSNGNYINASDAALSGKER